MQNMFKGVENNMQTYISKSNITDYVQFGHVKGDYPTKEWVEWSLSPHSEEEIKERVLNNRDSVCYTYLCRNSKLSERFIIELAILSLNEEITEDNYDEKMEELVPIFNENYDNRLDWKNISTYHKLSEEFIEKYKPLLDGKAIGENQVLSEEFIKNNLIVFIHPTTALNFQKHVSKEFRFHLYMIMDNYQDYYQAVIDGNKEYIDSIWNIPYIPKEEDYEG